MSRILFVIWGQAKVNARDVSILFKVNRIEILYDNG
jgi:hypothetical protein